MTRLTGCLLLLLAPAIAAAHHPNRQNAPVRPRVDVIGPVGNNLPPSYRRRYNRPSNLAGKIAYKIAPTSQEAIAWHRAQHAGLYREHAPRVVDKYFFPKPWEVLKVGPRPDRDLEEYESQSARGLIRERVEDLREQANKDIDIIGGQIESRTPELDIPEVSVSEEILELPIPIPIPRQD